MDATKERRFVACAMAALVLAGALVVVATPASGQDSSVTLAVLGETHGTRTVTKDLANGARAKGATGCLCPGDFIYGDGDASPSGWRSMMNPFLGNMIPAQGNHDYPFSDWSSLFPEGKSYHSRLVNGVRVIAINTEQSLSSGSSQRTWLESTLAKEPASAMKIVIMHRPWWLPSGAKHPTSEFEGKVGTSAGTMDGLMQKHGVDLVVSGHEKNYQHSQRNGIHYVVAGGAGPTWDKYPMGYSLPGAIKRLSSPVGSVVRLTPDGMKFESFDDKGGYIESFTIGSTSSSPAPSPSPTPGSYAPTFKPHDGNEWWVQVKLSEPASKVEARLNGGTWKPLTLRSWGSWAASLHAPSGTLVEFRATSNGGAVATSGAFRWTEGTPAGSGSTASATFTPHDGNEWWVQTRVKADSGVTKVEARVNGGAWKTLTLRSWGSWAQSFHAPTGSTVEFRATLSSGAQAMSSAYTWPVK